MAFPIAPTVGDTHNPGSGTYVYTADGVWRSTSADINVTSAAAAPASPSVGDEWYDTVNAILFKRVFNGASNVWLDISTSRVKFTAAATPPATPTVGDRWYDTDDGRVYDRINDGATDIWIELT